MRVNWKVIGRIILPIALALNVYAVWNSYQKDGPWRPLGAYPVPQQITNQNITVDETLDVTAIKCNNLKSPILISGSSQYQRKDKPEVVFPLFQGGIGIRKPGCSTLHFENPIPLKVQSYVNAQRKPISFVLSGVDTPLKTDCDLSPKVTTEDFSQCETKGSGDAKQWFTETFTISPKEVG